MTRRRSIALLAGAAALVATFAGPLAYADDDPHPIEEAWPEAVPTPWFCVGHEPNDICVPPW